MSDLCLLDTHVLIWAVAMPHRLTAAIRGLIDRRQYAASVASLWELINKRGKRDAPVRDPSACWQRYVVEPETPVLSIRSAHVLYLDRLPWRHRDPYDRILIAQAVVEEMVLITADDEIREYDIQTRDACS